MSETSIFEKEIIINAKAAENLIHANCINEEAILSQIDKITNQEQLLKWLSLMPKTVTDVI